MNRGQQQTPKRRIPKGFDSGQEDGVLGRSRQTEVGESGAMSTGERDMKLGIAKARAMASREFPTQVALWTAIRERVKPRRKFGPTNRRIAIISFHE